ncbi:MAG: nucleotide exchange factor GrpE [Methanobrevibacter sp.]|jgi:molecular chaperone GrpE|nr:nucleotide exchange factor GrpE [Methanobrevibacter sp.]
MKKNKLIEMRFVEEEKNVSNNDTLQFFRKVDINKILDNKKVEMKSILKRYAKDFKRKKNRYEEEDNNEKRFDDGKVDLILKIVDIYEAIEKGASLKGSSDKSLKDLLRIVYSKLDLFMEKEGLKKNTTKNEQFSHDNNEVSSPENNSDYEEEKKVPCNDFIDDSKLIKTVCDNEKSQSDREVAIRKIINNKKSENEMRLKKCRKCFEEKINEYEENSNKEFERGKTELINKINLEKIYENIEKELFLKEPSYKCLKEIYLELDSVLKNEGLEKIPTKNEQFDYNKHEAVLSENDTKYGDNKIIDELTKGYIFNGKVIKCSKVKICKNNE